jgi:C4-dicarboxylate-specific signal transduction histidine kinase
MHQAGTVEPAITITIAHRSNHYTMTVTDNGPGIPKDLQQSIFLPNFTTKKDGLAFGLGLGCRPSDASLATMAGSSLPATTQTAPVPA